MLGESEIRRIVDDVLAASRADQTEVEVFANDSALTRFANNYIHQNVEQTDVDVRVRAVIGQKIGIASDERDVARRRWRGVAARAYELAQHQRENEDFRSLPRPAPIAPVEAYVGADGALRAGGARGRRRADLRRVVARRADGGRRVPHDGAGVRGRELARRLRATTARRRPTSTPSSCPRRRAATRRA